MRPLRVHRMNWKVRFWELTSWRPKNDEERTRNVEERLKIFVKSPTETLQKHYGSASAWIFFTETCFLPKIAEMHSQRGLEHFETAAPSPIYRKKGRCLPPKDLMKKISKRTRITKFTSFSYFTEKLRKPYGSVFEFDFHLFSLPFHQC